MSTRSALSRKRGDDRGNLPWGHSIEKSLNELDTILAQEEVSLASTAGHLSTSRKSEGASSDKENKSRARSEGYNRLSSSLPGSPRRRRSLPDCDDSKSIGSNTIGSRDVTVYHHDLIANMEQIESIQEGDSASDEPEEPKKSPRSRKSRRSRSSSVTQRTKRGGSLEREISRTILQQTSDSSQFVVGNTQLRSKSTNDILSDLLGSSSSFWQTGPACEARSKSLLDEDDSVQTPSDGNASEHGRSQRSQSSGLSTGSPVNQRSLSGGQSPSGSSLGSAFAAPDLNQDTPTVTTVGDSTTTTATASKSTNELDDEEDIFAGLQPSFHEEEEEVTASYDSRSEFEKSFGTSLDLNRGDNFIDFSASTIIEESESDLVDSRSDDVHTNSLIAVTPFLELGVYTSTEQHEDDEEYVSFCPPEEHEEELQASEQAPSIPLEQAEEEERPVDLAPSKSLNVFSSDTMENSELSITFDDDAWTTFDNSTFAGSFRPSDDNASQESPAPSIIGEPTSPTSVLNASHQSTRKTSFSDTKINSALSKPRASSSDPGATFSISDYDESSAPLQPCASSDSGVEWQEYNRRFVI